MTQRTDRIDELLRQEIGLILAREAKDPRIGFATITQVETAPDLRHAKVWVSVMGSEAEQKETLNALRHAMHFVRRELGTRLRLRRIPDLHLRLDDSLERGTRILHLLHDLEEGAEVDEASLEPDLPSPVRRLDREGDAPRDPSELPAIPPPPDARRPSGRLGTGARPGAPRGSGGRAAGGRVPGSAGRPSTRRKGSS